MGYSSFQNTTKKLKSFDQTMSIPYPTVGDLPPVPYENSPTVPQGFADILRSKFPDWTDLHTVLHRKNAILCWGLLTEYQIRLSSITPKQILTANINGGFSEIVDQAHQSVLTEAFLTDLEKDYFPGRTSKRQKYENGKIDDQVEFMMCL